MKKLLRAPIKICIGLILCVPFLGRTQSFTEGFDATSTLTDWFVRNNSDSISSTTLTSGWGFGNDAVFPAQAGATGSYVQANYQSSNITTASATLSNWLFTPSRTFSNGDVITFYSRVPANPTTFPDGLEVRMSTAGVGLNVGTTSTSVGDFTTLLLAINPSLTATGYPGTWTQYSITITGLTGPTAGRVAFRHFVTNSGSGPNGNYVGIDSYTYTSIASPPANDNCAAAINLIQGTTCTPTSGTSAFATQSQAGCSGTANDDVWYKFTATSTGAIITVDGSTQFDAVYELFSGACGTLTSMGCIDNTVADGIETSNFNNLVVGQTYYIRVYDWGATAPGTPGFTICVQEFTQCDLTQPAGSILETEACGLTSNDGCNATTPGYQTLTCGQTVFGKAWATGGNRDTDWYQFTLTEPGNVTWSATAEFPFALILANATDCANVAVLTSGGFTACTAGSITFNITTPGTYIAFIAPTVFDNYACGTFNDYYATLQLPTTVPSITAAGATTFCAGANVALNSTGTGTFAWSNGTTSVGTNNAAYTASTTGNFSVSLTNANGCTSPSNVITVTATPLDDASFVYNSNTLCTGSSNVTPTHTASGTFSASPAGLTINSSTGEIDVLNSAIGSYTVTFLTTGTCPNSSAQTITVTDIPDAAFSYANAQNCLNAANENVVYGVGASGGVFSASPSGLSIDPSTGTINFGLSTAGNYTITNTIAASGACPASSATTVVDVLALPTATISGNGVICNAAGETNMTTLTVQLTGTAPFEITYTDGTTPITVSAIATNSYSFDVSAAGIYSVTSVSDANCSNTGTGTATVVVDLNPTITFAAISNLCSMGSPYTLVEASPTGGIYSGSGVSNGVINPNIAGVGTHTITYQYSNSNGCMSTATQDVTITQSPAITFGVLPTLCSTSTTPFTLTQASPAGGTYTGTGVSNGQFSPSVAGAGTFTISYSYTDAQSCVGTGSQTIVVESCLGIAENELANALNVYPNPSSDFVKVELNSSEIRVSKVELISLTGQVIQTIQLNSIGLNYELDCRDLEQGMYFIRIETNKGGITKSITKK